MLDALDAKGRVSYYAVGASRAPLMRRRVVRGERYDEVFGRDLCGEPTGGLPETEEGIKGAGLFPLDEIAAAGLIGAAVDRASSTSRAVHRPSGAAAESLSEP
ncbi:MULTISPECIES: hypothetical protein [unclassified Streptomyces]|uniref:hypothetical protein n=1 Tax=unclassified Streptomyces TaxID=2593676 RepID=UPI0037F61D2B